MNVNLTDEAAAREYISKAIDQQDWVMRTVQIRRANKYNEKTGEPAWVQHAILFTPCDYFEKILNELYGT